MQILPQFPSYKEHSRIFVCKDDRGVSYSLVNFSTDTQSKISSHWAVLSDLLERWSNGATSYDEDLYWDTEQKEMQTFQIAGFELTEILLPGSHRMFGSAGPDRDDKQRIKTRFAIRRI